MVSIIIPTYNRAGLIGDAAKSILNQTYKDFELIIVDDGSTDDTRTVIESINDNRVKYIWQENAGACAARNNGVKNSSGEYIAFQDSDDIWHRDKLERQVEYIKSTGADVVTCCLDKYINGAGVPHKFPIWEREDMRLTFSDLSSQNYRSTQTLLGKREVFEQEPFDENLPRLQDWELAMRLAKRFNFVLQNEVLVDVYEQDDSISKNHDKLVFALEYIFNKHYRNDMSEDATNFVTKQLMSSDYIKKFYTLYNDYQRLNAELYKTQQSLAAVLNSRFWKISEPIKKLLSK